MPRSRALGSFRPRAGLTENHSLESVPTTLRTGHSRSTERSAACSRGAVIRFSDRASASTFRASDWSSRPRKHWSRQALRPATRGPRFAMQRGISSDWSWARPTTARVHHALAIARPGARVAGRRLSFAQIVRRRSSQRSVTYPVVFEPGASCFLERTRAERTRRTRLLWIRRRAVRLLRRGW